jgi:hypothetical protein
VSCWSFLATLGADVCISPCKCAADRTQKECNRLIRSILFIGFGICLFTGNIITGQLIASSGLAFYLWRHEISEFQFQLIIVGYFQQIPAIGAYVGRLADKGPAVGTQEQGRPLIGHDITITGHPNHGQLIQLT